MWPSVLLTWRIWVDPRNARVCRRCRRLRDRVSVQSVRNTRRGVPCKGQAYRPGPHSGPAAARGAEPTKLRVDALIETKLREAGFVTFPAREWGEVFTRTQQEVGGLFDPRTGDLDEAKVKTIVARTIEDIRGRFQLDAVLLPRVQVVKANFVGAWARWDGVSDALASGLSVLATSGVSGTVPALSLVVSIDSPDGLALYRRGAGIQVLEKLAPVTERLSGKWLAPVPREEVLANEERNLAAVERALGPLLKK